MKQYIKLKGKLSNIEDIIMLDPIVVDNRCNNFLLCYHLSINSGKMIFPSAYSTALIINHCGIARIRHFKA